MNCLLAEAMSSPKHLDDVHEAPSRRSTGYVTVTAATEDGELIATRTLKCNK